MMTFKFLDEIYYTYEIIKLMFEIKYDELSLDVENLC